MEFLKLCSSYFGWLNTLSSRVARLRFFDFFTVNILFMVNQVAFILAAFLPLKLLILLGSEGVPGYLEFIVTTENKDDFIIYLAIAAVAAYLLYVLTEFVMNKQGKSVARFVVNKANKVSLFDQEETFVKDVFLRVAQSWSSYFMFIAGMALGFFLDWRVFGAITVAMVLEFFIISLIWQRLQQIENVSKKLSFVKNKVVVLNILSGFNFLVAFAALFYLFLVGEISNFIIAIIIILLARQIMARLTKAVSTAFFIVQSQSKIKALFFEDKHYEELLNPHEENFLGMLSHERRKSLFDDISRRSTINLNDYRLHWVDSGVKNLALFMSDPVGDAAGSYQLVLKIFGMQQKQAATVETQFLKELDEQLNFAPELMVHGDMGGFSFSILKTPPLEKISNPGPALKTLKWSLTDVELSDTMIDRFMRAIPTIAKRLKSDDFDSVLIATESDAEKHRVKRCKQAYSKMTGRLEALPVVLANRSLSPQSIYQVRGTDRVMVIYWHSLGIESFGAGLALEELSDDSLRQLPQVAQRLAQAKGPKLSYGDMRLAALLTGLEPLIKTHRFAAALAQCDIILAEWEKIREHLTAKQNGAENA